MSGVGVLHLTDTLDAGGAEVMCVQLANALPRDRFEAHVCATRRSGPLRQRIRREVGFLDLRRAGRWDAGAIWRLRRYVAEHRIRILHAHSTAVFAASMVKVLSPEVCVIWHDHCGRQEEKARPAALFRLLRTTVAGVITVNGFLEKWATERLGFRKDRVWLVPNFAGASGEAKWNDIPGEDGFRVVLLGNVRPEKDHGMMLRAMRRVVDVEPRARLLLVGRIGEDEHGQGIRRMVSELGLDSAVTLLGAQSDVGGILQACDVGVLSSTSEGLPLALLEYGMAGLGVVCTEVGDCGRVVRGGAGMLVAPGDDEGMARGILRFLGSPAVREENGQRLKSIVETEWSESVAVKKVIGVYDRLLAADGWKPNDHRAREKSQAKGCAGSEGQIQ